MCSQVQKVRELIVQRWLVHPSEVCQKKRELAKQSLKLSKLSALEPQLTSFLTAEEELFDDYA